MSDTTMAFVDFGHPRTYPRELLPRVARLRDKVLFGSDFPNIPYPFEHAVEGLVRLGLGDAWLKAVLRECGFID